MALAVSIKRSLVQTDEAVLIVPPSIPPSLRLVQKTRSLFFRPILVPFRPYRITLLQTVHQSMPRPQKGVCLAAVTDTPQGFCPIRLSQ
jgi:hypothetical protein